MLHRLLWYQVPTSDISHLDAGSIQDVVRIVTCYVKDYTWCKMFCRKLMRESVRELLFRKYNLFIGGKDAVIL